MTPEERAHLCWINHPCDTSEPEEQIKFVAAQIREMEKEAGLNNQELKDSYKHWTNEAYKQGRAYGLEEAARIVEECVHDRLSQICTCRESLSHTCDMHHLYHGIEVALEQIRWTAEQGPHE